MHAHTSQHKHTRSNKHIHALTPQVNFNQLNRISLHNKSNLHWRHSPETRLELPPETAECQLQHSPVNKSGETVTFLMGLPLSEVYTEILLNLSLSTGQVFTF